MSITYKDAGVDIEKGDALVEKIKQKVKRTYNKRVLDGVGGFACLYDMEDGRYLAAGTDGVGTKIKLAQELNKHDTVGIDLVAMCANDILCTGAKSLFFMDYFATGKLDLGVGEQIIEGVVKGCELAELALIGGETAEMPGMYPNGEYDLAGFAIGEVHVENLVNGAHLKEGDELIGLPSSGFHSNGYSLLRKLFNENDKETLMELLTPTRIYYKVVQSMLNEFKKSIKGMAHITGGGLLNVPRMNESFDYEITPPPLESLLPIFKKVKDQSSLSDEELYKTFNMGIGLVIATDRGDDLRAYLTNKGETHFNLGKVKKGKGDVYLNVNGRSMPL